MGTFKVDDLLLSIPSKGGATPGLPDDIKCCDHQEGRNTRPLEDTNSEVPRRRPEVSLMDIFIRIDE